MSVDAIKAAISTIHEQYKAAKALKEECKDCERTAASVQEMLPGIQKASRRQGILGIEQQLATIQDALNEMSRVVKVCATRRLFALVFAKTLLVKIRASTSNIKDALQYISGHHVASSFKFQNETRLALRATENTLRNLRVELSDLTSAIHRALRSDNPRDALVTTLHTHHLAASEDDARRQLDDELQSGYEILLADNKVAEQWLLDVVKSLSIHSAADRRTSVEAPPDTFVCPITKQVMFDPVRLETATQVKWSYERSAIAEQLRRDPCLDPCTGMRSPKPLEFTSNPKLKERIEAWRAAQRPPEASPSEADSTTEPPPGEAHTVSCARCEAEMCLSRRS